MRSAPLGIFIGALPGLGSDIAAWLGYDMSKRFAKKPEEFGNGSVEGLAGCEVAKSAEDGGAIIPTVTFGIPGDSQTVVILGALWMKPSLPVFFAAMFAWGLNMGVTTTLVRTTVQELAEGVHRAQILSVLLVSFMISAPLSSMLLGNLIAGYDPLTALIPGVVISLVIFVVGVTSSRLWQYEAPTGPVALSATP